jgi:hypothetical protein
MSEYSEVEKPFLDQLATLGSTVLDQGGGIPQELGPSLRALFRKWLPPATLRGVRAPRTGGRFFRVRRNRHRLPIAGLAVRFPLHLLSRATPCASGDP